MNINNLKIKFPNYKITDASNRNPQQIIRICSICDTSKNLLVFIERNVINENYFKHCEKLGKAKIGTYKYMIITDKTYFVSNGENYENYILHLQRIFNNDNTCPICFGEDIKEYLYCNQCATMCCLSCFDQLENELCPICRHESFSLFSEE